MTTKTQARKTSPSKKTTQRDVKQLLTDGAYATVGAGDNAFNLVKTLPQKVGRLREEVPTRVRTAPKTVTETVDEFRTKASKEFDTYAKRGRNLVKEARTKRSTQRALEQTRTARAQVRAAATSVRKALRLGAEATEEVITEQVSTPEAS